MVSGKSTAALKRSIRGAELTPGEKMNAVAELIRIETMPDKVRADAELVEEFE